MNHTPLPDEPIKLATAYFAGERAAGIFPHYYDIQLFLDLQAFDEKDQHSILEECRGLIGRLYGIMAGEEPTVLFDFELKHQVELERQYGEPDYDAPKLPTPMESHQKEDEHHV